MHFSIAFCRLPILQFSGYHCINLIKVMFRCYVNSSELAPSPPQKKIANLKIDVENWQKLHFIIQIVTYYAQTTLNP